MVMKKSEELFLAVLRAGLRKDKGALCYEEFDEETRKEALKLAGIHGLLALYYEGLLFCVSEPLDKLKITASIADGVGKAAAVYDEYRKAVEALGQSGVRLITMKGYVLRRLYPVPEYRSFGDVDLLIGKGDAKRAVEILEGLGFKREINESHIAAMRKDRAYFEMHTRLLCEDSFTPLGAQDLVSDPWEYAVETGTAGVCEFTAEFHVFYLILHIAKHFYNQGAGVRMFLDIALLAEKDGCDWALVGEYLKEAELADFGRCVFAVCESFFGTKTPSGLFDGNDNVCDAETLSELLSYVLDGGTFGYEGPAYEVAVLRQAYFENAGKDSDSEVKKQTAFRAVIPTRETMEKRYPFCKKSVLLLPAAHIVRVASVISNRRRARSAVKRMKILCASEEIARKQVDFYVKIGL